MTTFNGLNGTIMLNTGDEGLLVGYVPGSEYDAKRRLRVTVDVRIERLERHETYQTTTHEQVTRPLDLSITTNVWRPDDRDILAGGATARPLRQVAMVGAPARFWDADNLTTLARLADRWHLNSMRAACQHQQVVWEDSQAGRRPSLTETAPCPHTGYRYGSSWLVEPLPRGALAMLRHLLRGPIENRNVYVHPDLTRLTTF